MTYYQGYILAAIILYIDGRGKGRGKSLEKVFGSFYKELSQRSKGQKEIFRVHDGVTCLI